MRDGDRQGPKRKKRLKKKNLRKHSLSSNHRRTKPKLRPNIREEKERGTRRDDHQLSTVGAQGSGEVLYYGQQGLRKHKIARNNSTTSKKKKNGKQNSLRPTISSRSERIKGRTSAASYIIAEKKREPHISV